MGSYSYEVVYSVSITNIISIYHLQSVQVASEGPDSLRLASGLILGGIKQLLGQNFAIFSGGCFEATS